MRADTETGSDSNDPNSGGAGPMEWQEAASSLFWPQNLFPEVKGGQKETRPIDT